MGVRPERLDLAPPASVAVGPTFDTRRLTGKNLQVSGTFVATLQLEGSVDGDNFVNVGGGITTPGVTAIPGYFSKLRIRTAAFTSGTPVAILGALFQRE